MDVRLHHRCHGREGSREDFCWGDISTDQAEKKTLERFSAFEKELFAETRFCFCPHLNLLRQWVVLGVTGTGDGFKPTVDTSRDVEQSESRDGGSSQRRRERTLVAGDAHVAALCGLLCL